MIRRIALSLALAAVAGCAHSPPSDPQDPLESVNRKIYSFNDTVDEYTAKPVARVYRRLAPEPIERGVGNFYTNLKYPITVANQLLQAKPGEALRDLARMVINTTAGFGGFLDPADHLGLPADDEDFGQTLGYWGVGPGIYLVLPILGPSTGRGLFGDIPDEYLDPINYVDDTVTRIGLHGGYLLNFRASLLPFEKQLENAFDEYLFVRTTYLEDRRAKVHDGDPPREFD